MREVPTELARHLMTGATTLCWCWRLTRKDGMHLGFTDHDRNLEVENTTFEAAAGFTASEMKQSLGLSVDNLDVTGALSSGRLTEADLAAGLYDDAKVEVFRVNWQRPDQHVLMRVGSLGEVRRAGTSFSAEVRGLAHYLQQPKGRLFQYACDADVGDERCGVDLSSSSYRGEGTLITARDERVLSVEGLGSFESDWFTRGLLTFTSGPAKGQAVEIKRHARRSNGEVIIELWHPARAPLVAGQTLVVTAGCDKLIETCRNKFQNAINHRGFPHMPGNDFVTGYVRRGGA